MIQQSFPNREAIREHQLIKLRRLLDTVASDNAFYAPILRQAGLDGEITDLDEFLNKMPLTLKESIIEDQRLHPPYGTNLTYSLEKYSRFNQTSATSGKPMCWLDTEESWQWMLDNWKRVFQAAEVQATDCLYFAFSFGPFLGFWTAFEAAVQMGCRSMPGGGMSSLSRLEAMRDNRATALCCTPTYALRLAEVAREENIDLAEFDIRAIIVAGEPGGSVPATRQRIENLWPGATVFDHHGMTEVGPVSFQSRDLPHSLVIIESSYIAEIINPETGQPVEPGTVGELVLTTLGRLGSPLIRYRTGDLVCQDHEIAQQQGLHEMVLKGGILGRTDNMVSVRGVNIYPNAIEELMRSFSEVAEYRVEIRSGTLTEMHIQVESVSNCCDHQALVKKIEAKTRSLFNLRVPVSVCQPGTLPRFEMKARRWIRT